MVIRLRQACTTGPARLVAGSLLSFLGACASGPAFTADEMPDLRAFQDAVRAVQHSTDAELFTERPLFTLPEGLSLHMLDLHGRTGWGLDGRPGGKGIVVVCFDGALSLIGACNFEIRPQLNGEFAHYDCEGDHGTRFLACGGRALLGFDQVLRYAMHGDDGLVVAGVRHGAACLIAGDRVEDRSPFAAYYPPRLSLDGSRISYAQWNLFGSRPMWAATAAPHQCELLTFPGVMDWPPVMNRDGSRWAATSRDGNTWCAVENGDVLARFDQLETPWLSEEGDSFVWRGTVDGKERLLIGRTLSEPFDHVVGPDFIPGGSWHFVGRDAQGSHLVVDGRRVADQKGDGYVVRAAGGQAWAWQVRDADGIRIVHGERIYGPYPEATSVVGLMLSGDGRTIAFEHGHQGWLVDGAPLAGGDFERAEEVQLLDGGGCVYVGMRSVGKELEYWLVTPAGRYGPWDGVGGRKLSTDGTRLAFAAWRGREVWRKVVPVR